MLVVVGLEAEQGREWGRTTDGPVPAAERDKRGENVRNRLKTDLKG
jgi:hypothetical protein